MALWLDQHGRNISPRSIGLPSEVIGVDTATPRVVETITHADARLLPNHDLIIDLIAVVTCLFDVEVEPHSRLGERFGDRIDDIRRRDSLFGTVEEKVTFIITSLVAASPGHEIKRMDAILLTKAEE